MKDETPIFLRPSSPDRKLKFNLEDIPEAIPGPNAFAIQAARVERHRLEGNAFYQQEVQRRKMTPPTGLHPAMRTTSFSTTSSPPRDSSYTTMSPSVAAGNPKENSPPLKLLPWEADMAEPTRRGYIEEHSELMQYERSGSRAERTPVFVPTPKISSTDWAKPTTPQKRPKEKTSDSELPTKTPKRGLLERLKITTNLRGNSTPDAGCAWHITVKGADAYQPRIITFEGKRSEVAFQAQSLLLAQEL